MAVPIPRRGNRKAKTQESVGCDFSLCYAGKQSIEAILEKQPGKYATTSKSKADANRLYHADNLPVLAALAQDESVVGKVRVVYIDPPFATAASFESRKLNHAYDDQLVGPEFVEALRARLVFIHRLLADDGSLYLHLDGRMAFRMKVVLDEIFGEQNFRNCITRKKCNPKNYTRKTFGNVADYILFYTKTDDYVWNRPMEPWDDARAMKEYQYTDEDGRRYKKVPVHAPGVRNGATGQKWRGKSPPPGKHWQYPPAVLDEMDARGEIYWSPNGNPRRKIYFESSEGVPLQDIWMDVRDAHNQNIKITGYPTEKNPVILARAIEASSNPGDLVLDCYAGSGTTLAIADQCDRRWIGVDRSDEAIKTILHRMKYGTGPMGDFVGKKKQTPTLPLFSSSDFALYSECGTKKAKSASK
jgi:adenine-specific DNA-methyltransferase